MVGVTVSDARPRLKVCCIATIEEAELAVTCGAMAIGLVSEMPSGPGVISDDCIEEIATKIPSGISTFLLTSSREVQTIVDQQRRFAVDTIQLCDDLQPEEILKLRRLMPGISIVQVIHVERNEALDQARMAAEAAHALLLDSGDSSKAVKELGGHEVTSPTNPIPGFKWPVAASRTISAPTSKIWDLISSPGSLPLYHPFCEKNPVFDWPGPNSNDEVQYFNGVVLARRFSAWYDDIGYDLEIGRPGGRSSVVSWRIAAVKEQRSSIKITVYPHALQRVPPVIRWLPHLVRLRPHLGRYLQSVVNGLDWFITRGQPVRRNQFGAHNWFSPEAPNT